MSAHESCLRFTTINRGPAGFYFSFNFSQEEVISKVTENYASAGLVVRELLSNASSDYLSVLDIRHLYGRELWEVYHRICGRDISRFIYHIEMELPCQICGKLDFLSGKRLMEMTEQEKKLHCYVRRFGSPGSFWAVEPEYPYPLIVLPVQFIIK